jgi:hypothetical protein
VLVVEVALGIEETELEETGTVSADTTTALVEAKK